ncbi:MAG: hypothetical protein K6A96_10970 [Prevotella sp.]|nr:hypothetical protein [Prevotella sp.]
MKPENLNINFAEGENRKEIVIREIDKVVETELPALEPEKLSIEGTITAPARFLEKRWQDEQVEHSRTHILVDRDKMHITLIANETDRRNRMTVVGRLMLSRQYLAFGINEKEDWDPVDLANFFRINRTYFDGKEENMKLVTALKGFQAKVSQTVEREEKDNGSRADVFRQVVDSSLPESFAIRIPIFKDSEPALIKVEIIAHVHGRDFELELISPEAAAILEEHRDKIIDEQLALISMHCPEIPIIEV